MAVYNKRKLMSKNIIPILLAVLFNINCQAEIGPKWFVEDSLSLIETPRNETFEDWGQYFVNLSNTKITKPIGFFDTGKQITVFLHKKGNSPGRPTVSYAPCLESKDKECLIAMSGPAIPFPAIKKEDATSDIYRFITGTLSNSSEDAEKYITFISQKASAKIANADKAYFIDIPLGTTLANKWKFFQGIYFEKKGRSISYLGIFYTDKGYSNMAKYLPAAFSIFKYNDN